MMRIIAFVLCFIAFVHSHDLNPVVTKSGPINGLLQKTIWHQKPFYSFRGIPYAEPPIGELRFKAPVPIKPWTEPLNAHDYGNMCSQRFRESPPCSEDCLFLNIFVPKVNGTKKLPVLFFIHGGRFTGGSGDDSRYGPDFLIEHEIILVTANYRTGILGFMSLGTDEYSGNMGLKDQQLALKWIYENIKSFGGDKNKITIGGISAGAQSVGLHEINKESSKYFSQILSISGTPNSNDNYQKGDHRCLLEIFYRKFHPEKPDLESLIEFLKKVDVNAITQFTAETVNERLLPWAPIVEKADAKQPFLLDEPLSALQKFKGLNKPAYFTITNYEQMVKDEDANYSNPNVVDAYLNDFNIDFPVFGYDHIISKKPPYLTNLLSRIREFYFGDFTKSTPRQRALHRIIQDSDLYWTYFIEKWIEHHVAISRADTFYHQFSIQTLMNQNMFEGAGHGDEQCYLFRCRRYNTMYPAFLAGNGRDAECTKIVRTVNSLLKLFSNFIKHGNPRYKNDPIEKFTPVKRKSKPNQFNFMDITNDGFVPGVAPSGNRTQFLDSVVEEMIKLVHQHNDTPTKTPIEYQCDAMKGNSLRALLKANDEMTSTK